MPAYIPLLELTRCNIVESTHFGAVVVSDARGDLLAWAGAPDTVATLRSSAKPFQIIPFLESGGQAAFQLSPREIALMCASHSGTDEHVSLLQQIQAKTGVKEADLLCGIHKLGHLPTVEAMRQRGETLSPNRHNCSGKHTGMLAAIRLRAQSGEHNPALPYISPEHPLQRQILHALAEMCGVAPESIPEGIDGCSAPTFALPMRSAAQGFARLCDPTGLPPRRSEACQTIVAAMTSHPDMVGGPESFDTHLMQVTHGRILCKGGAEGYLAMGLRAGAIRRGSPALGIVIKISDGDLGVHSRDASEPGGRARPAVALEVLRQLDAIAPEELSALAVHGPSFPLRNWRKLDVGEGRTCFLLNVER